MFLSSMNPDISEDIPTPLSGGGVRALEQTGDNRFDCAINGLPFNLRISTYTPYRRASEPVRKEQIDTSTEAGEQSLSTWWIRSQSSWHLGSGIRYYEPGAEQATVNRYATSQGINPWTQGQITLLYQMVADQTGLTEPVHLSTFRSMGRDGWCVASADKLYWRGGVAPGGSLVRTNYTNNPRLRSTATNAPGWTNTPSGTDTDVTATGTGPLTGTAFDVGYRQFVTSASGTTNKTISDRLTGTSGNPVTGINVGDTITASEYAYASWTGGASMDAVIWINWYDSGGTNIKQTSATFALASGVYRRLDVRATRPSGSAYFRITLDFVASASVPSGATLRAGNLLVEKGADLNPWFDGQITDAGGHDYFWSAINNSISTDTYTPGVTRTMPSSGATQPAPVGGSIFVGRTNAVSKWDVNTDIFTSPWTCTGVARCWWVKNRLIVAVGKDLYWINHLSSGVIETNGTKIASGPDDSWVWVDVADTADAILAAGAGDTASSIVAFTVTESGGVPTFSAGREVARLPQGEQPTCMGSYLAAFVIVGTTKGIRVAASGSQGELSLGPLSVELAEGPKDVTFFDRFAYLPVTAALPDGSTGVVRMDLSEQIAGNRGEATGLFPWAWDVTPGGTATATSICMNGNTGKVVLAHGGNTHLEDTTLLTTGYLDSGLIRYRTAEMKDFQRARVTGDLNQGSVKLSALINGTENSIYTYGNTTGLEGESTLNLPGGPLFAEMQFRLRLTRNGTLSPVVTGLAVKAMPSVTKSRLYEYPLSVYDFEENRHGMEVGYQGFGIDRIQELEALEDAGAAIQITDKRYNETIVATIEGMEFKNFDPPDGHNNNGGGVVSLTVRVR